MIFAGRVGYVGYTISLLHPISELKSYVQNNKIIFYTEFNWTDCDNLIKEICIGSKCEADEDDIKKYLLLAI